MTKEKLREAHKLSKGVEILKALERFAEASGSITVTFRFKDSSRKDFELEEELHREFARILRSDKSLANAIDDWQSKFDAL